MKLSIVVPVYNEQATIRECLRRVNRQLKQLVSRKLIDSYEIIVVNDGSSDNTSKVISSFAKSKAVSVFNLPKNQGKGAALRFGFEKCSGDIILTQDADLEYHPDYYSLILEPLLSSRAQVVYGTRIGHLPLNWRTLRTIPLPLHFIGNKLLSFLTRLLYQQQITDMETGYKAMTRKVYDAIYLTSRGFEIEVELTAKIINAGFQIHEVPIATTPRGYDEGKKITFIDAVWAVYYLILYSKTRFYPGLIGILSLGAVLRLAWLEERIQLDSHTVTTLFNLQSNQTDWLVRYQPWNLIVNFGQNMTDSYLFGYYMSGVTGWLLIFVSGRVGYLLMGRVGTLIMSLLVATSPALIDLGLESGAPSLLPLSLMILGWSLLEFIRSQHYFWLILFGVGIVTSLWLEPASIYPSILVYAWAFWHKRERITKARFMTPVLVILGLMVSNWPGINNLLSQPSMIRHHLRWFSSGEDFSWWVAVTDLMAYWSGLVGGYMIYGLTLVALGSSWAIYKFGFVRGHWPKKLILLLGLVVFVLEVFHLSSTGFISIWSMAVMLTTAYMLFKATRLDKLLGWTLVLIVLLGNFVSLSVHLQRNDINSVRQAHQALIQVYQSDNFVYYFQEGGDDCARSLKLLDSVNPNQSMVSIGLCTQESCPMSKLTRATFRLGQIQCQVVTLRTNELSSITDQGWNQL